MLQIFLFVLSYSCARTVGDSNDWRNRPVEVLAVSSSFTVLFMLLGSVLPKSVPNFVALMAMPPYCDQQNVETFFNVLDEYNTQHCGQAVQSNYLTGSVRPNILAERPAEVPSGTSTELKMMCERFDKAFCSLKHDHNQLAGQVQDMKSSISMSSTPTVNPHSTETTPPPSALLSRSGPNSDLRDCGTALVDCELGVMRAHLARLEGLIEAQHCHHPFASVDFKSMEKVGIDADCSPQIERLPRCCSNRDLKFFVHSPRHEWAHLEQGHHAGPTRGADDATDNLN